MPSWSFLNQTIFCLISQLIGERVRQIIDKVSPGLAARRGEKNFPSSLNRGKACITDAHLLK
jgi:hypothetical protein